MLKKAYELGVRAALEDAGLTKEAGTGDFTRALLLPWTASKEKADREQKALAALLGAGTAGIGTGLATGDAGYGALAAPLGGAAGYGLASLLSNRGTDW